MNEREPRPKAVVDTNVLARFALTPRGFSARLLAAIEAGDFLLITSEAILSEVAETLTEPRVRRYRRYSDAEIEAFVGTLREFAHVVPGRYEVFVVQNDPDDNHVLAAAIEGDADFVVTDDRRHLLPLKNYHRIQIVSDADS